MPSISKWLTNLLPRKQVPSGFPLGLSQEQVEHLHQLVSTPHWRHYLAALELVCEREAAQLATGLPQEKYMFQCGVFYALRQAHSLAANIVAATQNLEEIKHGRDLAAAAADQRRANTFLNTPWWNGYTADRDAATHR